MLSQNQRVLNHLIDHGYITQSIASNYGIRRLASRIDEIKQQNVEVLTEYRKDDAGVRYAYYHLNVTIRAVERIRRDNGLSWRGGTKSLAVAA
jgi:hypothetical protein